MTESSRSKTIEVMARAMQEKPTSWVTPTPWGMLCETVRVEWRKKAEAALTAYESHLQAEGMAVVPVIPTEEMLDAYWDQTGESREMRARTHVSMRRYYAAMLAVAPLANPRRENDK